MKRVKVLGIIFLTLMFMFMPFVATVNAMEVIATYNEVELRVRGEMKELEAYNIEGYNYFEIDSLCRIFNWSVQIDAEGVILIVTEFEERAFLDISSDSFSSIELEVQVLPREVSFNNNTHSISGVSIGGNEYLRIRDLAEIATYSMPGSAYYLDLRWDAETKIITCSLPKVGNLSVLSADEILLIPVTIGYIEE